MTEETEWIGASNLARALGRKSSQKQKENSSHETQEKEIRNYCHEHGLKLLSITPIIESAKDSDSRKKYREFIESCLREGVRHIVFYMFDRETRNLTDNERNEKLVKEGKIVIHYVHDRKVYHRHSSDSDFFLRDIQAVTNKQFIRNLRAKVVDAMTNKADEGWFPGNRPVLGYVHQKIKDEYGRDLKRGTIIGLDPYTKNVEQVKREFELRGYERKTLEQIADQLVVEGFITQKQRRNYESSIERRLKNTFYAGYFNWPKGGPEYRGKHELFISSSLFKQVQETFGQGGLYRKKNGDFSGGWLKCGHENCGCHIVYDPKEKTIKSTGEKKMYRLYRCSNGKKIHQSFGGMYAYEEDIWEQFSKVIDEISISDDFAKELSKAINASKLKAQAAIKREMDSYREALKALEGKEDVAYEDFRKGLLDESAYQRQLKHVREKRAKFTDLLEGAQNQISDAGYETVQSTIELAKNAKTLWLSRSPEERRELLEEVLSNRFLDGPIVRYDLEKPFATLAEMKKSENWRAQTSEYRIWFAVNTHFNINLIRELQVA